MTARRARNAWLRRVVGLLLIVGVLWLAFEAATWPSVRALRTRPPTSTAFIDRYKARERAAGRTPRVEWRWVPSSAISIHLKRAVVVAEDTEFFHHRGFAPKAMREAMTQALEERRAPRGASTITQQLAKNLWLSPERTVLRKARESVLTWQLEKSLSKRRILECYVNVVEFGPGVYGAEGARVRAEVPMRFDVPYGAHHAERLDVFMPQTPAPAPIHVFIHGGYWHRLDKAD